MPPRVAYWTSAFDPAMEAVSAEVALLRRHFRRSVAWGLSPRHWLLLSPRRGYCLNPRLHLLFRAVTRLAEPAFHLNHVFGSLGDWFYLQGKRRRPTVLTTATAADPVDSSLLERVDQFVVEHPGGEAHLVRAGIEPRRIRLIFPPVDLHRFSPAPAPAGRFTVLFASSPDRQNWLAARGVPQLLDAAALRPRMFFRLLWRPWGDSLPQVRQWVAERGLRNVEIVVGCRADMAAQYRGAHVTAAPFTDMNRAKPAPNSLVESLACGRPVLTTEAVGLAALVAEGGAGVVSPATGEGLASHLDRLEADWPVYAAAARRLAERWFGVEQFLAGYQQLYDQVLAHRRGRVANPRGAAGEPNGC